MIKTVIALLLFGTLVVGIAGHSSLKQVGSMGCKSLLYFEVVTSMALIISLIAINISKAGVGIELPAAAVPLKGVAQSWEEVVLQVFPEKIANLTLKARSFRLLSSVSCLVSARP